MAYLYATASGVTSKTYPIGKGGIYRPLTLSLTQTDATLSTYTAEMFNSAPPPNALPGTLNSVSSIRYYTISEGVGGSAFTAGSVKLSYDADDGVDAANLRIAQGPSSGSGTWVNLGGTGSGSPAGTITSTTDFTSLTNTIFTLGNLGFKLTLKAFIQGLSNGGGTAMTNAVNPITVSVGLHNATTPYALVESKTGDLSTSGVGIFNFTTAVNGTPYYIVVKSGNSIETWSNTTHSFTSSLLSYDFTTAANKAFGDNLFPKGSTYCIYSGDVNQDGLVDSGDLGLIDNDYSNYESGPGWVTDINGDGIVDSGDLGLTDNNYSSYVSIIQPSGAPAKHVTRQVPSVKNVK
jgi:hypothetical protein